MRKSSVLIIILASIIVFCGCGKLNKREIKDEINRQVNEVLSEYDLEADNIQVQKGTRGGYEYSVFIDDFENCSYEKMLEIIDGLKDITLDDNTCILEEVHSGVHTYTADYKTLWDHGKEVYEESLSSGGSSGSSSSGSSRTCPNCNGTGAVKYNYGASDAEAYADGQDPYQIGECPMCHGTGKVNN